MKKKLFLYLLVFVCLFLYGSIDVHAADSDYIWFDTNGFTEQQYNDFHYSFCSNDSFGCLYKCEGYEDGITDAGNCGGIQYVDSFAINFANSNETENLESIKYKLGKSRCPHGSSTSCLDFVKKNYCSANGEKVGTKICTFLNNSSGNVMETNEDEGVCPPVTLETFRISCSGAEGVTLTINYSKSNKMTWFDYYTNNSNVIVEDDSAYICDNVIHLYSKGGTSKDFSKDFLSKIKKSTCPSITWCTEAVKGSDGYYNTYAELSGKCDPSKYEFAASQTTDGDGISSGVHYSTSETNYANIFGQKLDIVNCETLFGSEGGDNTLLDIIKFLLGAVRILIPLLLLVLGSVDFVKAIVAQDEGVMKKAQQTFIKRLIIAVVIFLIPSLIKVLLNIASGIWPFVKPDDNGNFFCGLL